MAIGYARIEFVKRSNGKTSCAKAAYNAKTAIEFQGNSHLDPQTYNWASKTPPAYHEILLPKNANEKFKSPQTLWNAVEKSEKKCNSVVAMELLLALPDDKLITLEDRIYLTKTFVQTHFIDKGLAAQIDVHPPERKIQITQNDQEKGLFKGMSGNLIEENADKWTVQFDSTRVISFNPNEFTGFVEKENNWHAHVLITTRRFNQEGVDLGDKARDLMPRICNGKVISGPEWGKLWTDHQNQFFHEKGLPLRVDPLGIQPQEHLGPVRMRGRAFALLEEHGRLVEQNTLKSQDPKEILENLTQRQSVFTKNDLEAFLQKHVPIELHENLTEAFWQQEEVIPLLHKDTGNPTDKFSSIKVLEEEKQILRLADKLYSQNTFQAKPNPSINSQVLNEEQKTAFHAILEGRKLACLQGYAGTGKSHLLASLKDFYSHSGIVVRAFGPDSATADVLKEKGFQETENIYRFLFALHNRKRPLANGKEVWILDEAGKLGNRPLLELLREADKHNIFLILSGDYAQLNPIERGNMFKIFCERYESLSLKNIQRQKDESQREIALNLASGEVDTAIDKLSESAIQWSSTKKEAIEELIIKWALDTRSSPHLSTLIIAGTNAEVRLLNEMVRAVKKQRGQLSDKEFSCQTSLGKIYVSPGDRIEFRKNDNHIGVTNGLTGTLLEASQNKFTISIDGKSTRIVTFDPQEYHTYQLGYASTYFRSQGQTIDKAYVLHSPSLNKKMFYVGLTRHVHEAFYFISKEQAYCLADLKRQASRSNNKETTLDFTTHQNLQEEQQAIHRQNEIQQLKNSDAFLNKIKGYGLSIYDLCKSKAESLHERFSDRIPNQEFYHINQQHTPVKAEIQELSLPQTLKHLLKEENTSEPNPSMSNVGQLPRHKTPDQLFASRLQTKPSLWNAFSPQKQELLKSYFSSATQASSLQEVVGLESTASKIGAATHFKEWQEACGNRNRSAHQLTLNFSTEELSQFLGKKATEFITTQACRYQAILQQNEKPEINKLEEALKENIEPLLYRLFPDGPFKKDNKNFRFGSKGSLAVIHSGDKTGQFYDFEKQEGGGILKLIQLELGLGRLEAKEWSKSFLVASQDIKIPQAFIKASKNVSRETEWISLVPDSKTPAPPLHLIGNGNLHKYFNEITRHPYRDEQGQLLYYCLRLVDRNDPTKKITPPLSYGYWKSTPDQPCWELKGFYSEKNFLYNLPSIQQNPLATVLIVEGEKTADAALNHLPKESLICITWPGGAGSTRRADWTPLTGRNVIIWPDNDKPGFQAANDICQELRKVGISSLRMIDPSTLQKHFPEKWDLADLIPSNLDKNFLQDLVHSAPQKGIDPEQIIHRASSLYKNYDFIDKARVNEILWRVDARMRPELEQKLGPHSSKINETIALETAKLLLQQGYSQAQQMPKPLSWQLLVYEASYGKSPAEWEITRMQKMLQKLPTFNHPNKLQSFAVDKLFTEVYEKSLLADQFSPKKLQQEMTLMTQSLEKQKAMNQLIEQTMQKEFSKNPTLDCTI